MKSLLVDGMTLLVSMVFLIIGLPAFALGQCKCGPDCQCSPICTCLVSSAFEAGPTAQVASFYAAPEKIAIPSFVAYETGQEPVANAFQGAPQQVQAKPVQNPPPAPGPPEKQPTPAQVPVQAPVQNYTKYSQPTMACNGVSCSMVYPVSAGYGWDDNQGGGWGGPFSRMRARRAARQASRGYGGYAGGCSSGGCG